MNKNIYSISNFGTITHFGHFFYALLIPLIYYDIKTEGKFTYNIKIDVGSNIKILNPNNFLFTKNDIVIFLAWRFQNFFIKKYKNLFIKNHYKILQLLPKFKIIEKF